MPRRPLARPITAIGWRAMAGHGWSLSRFLAFALVVVAMTWRLPAAARPTAGAFTRSAPPTWIAAASAETPSPAKSDAPPIVDLVVDDQLRIGATLEHYLHRSRRIATLAGVERGSEIEIEIDPSYERFVLHRLEIQRGTERLDASKTADIRVLDAEDSRDRRLYNGTRSIVFVLADVRVGDVVEWAGTIVGQNPVYGRRFAHDFRLGSARPTLYRRVRILSPKDRPLRALATGHPAKTDVVDGMNLLLWEGSNPPDPPEEDHAPDWFRPTPHLMVSEYESWTDVARWAAPLYEVSAKPDPRIAAKVAQIAAGSTSPQARALAALRFVQDDVRYLGIELGESSHRPHAASKVLEQRFGDCKDKVMLLLALLRGLGIEAHAVLVNTDLDARLRDELPAPTAFDHVIARIRIDGKDVWVDATRSLERGPLGATAIMHGLGLVASPDSTDLVSIPATSATEPLKEVVETFTVTGSDARLDVVSTYRSSSADALRSDLDAGKRADLEKEFLAFYERQYPSAKRHEPMTVEDDEVSGRIVIRESYDLPGAIAKSRLATWGEALASVVVQPKTQRREAPLAVRHPSFFRHTIVVEGLALEPPQDVTVADGAIDYRLRAERRPAGVRLVHELRTLRDHVMPADVARHLEARKTVRDALEQDLEPPSAAPPAKKEKSEHPLADIAVVVIFCAMVGGFALYAVVTIVRNAVGGARTTGRRWWWRRRRNPSRGQVASMPLRVANRAVAERAVYRESCECGARADAAKPPIRWSTVALGGESVASARIECTSCGAARVRYFELEQHGHDDVGIDERGRSG
ncbi:MAG: DUF3857 domain-containing protein [Deltaproteobacteria bacterium]|nr:DUF3857 domain-containing protein [Deltaproteobacteria bacterium]